MRPSLVEWLVQRGWPAWFCPDYATMVGASSILAAWLVLRQAERDGARVHVQARALAWAYVAALVGGYVFEWIRMIPVAIAERSVWPIVFAGRAAYGGLIFGTLAPVVYLKWRRETVLDFLDRATIGMGIVFACVRFGCFLEGCDFGRPTASWFGVRFPEGSLAAEAHTSAGWIPPGVASLPVHPTELYESGVGLLATSFSCLLLRTRRRDGSAFAAWITTYALGRFLVELLRGDASRGHYGGLSTAQWVSVSLLVIVVAFILARRRPRRRWTAFVAAAVMTCTIPRTASADEPLPELPTPTPSPATEAPASASASPSRDDQVSADKLKGATDDEPRERVATVRVALASSLTLARPDVPSGWAVELDALYRLRLGKRLRADLGIEGRRYENVDAIHLSFGLAAELALEVGRHFELLTTLVPHHTWFDFKSEYFTNTNAYGLRYGLGAQFPIGPAVLGVAPLAFTTTSATTVGVISQWEPRFWAGASF